MVKNRLALLFLVGIGSVVFSQEKEASSSFDTNYLEDQFYIGLGYNFLVNKPDVIIQRNLSYNLQLGIVKDIPLNKKRNFGIGIGVGYATNSYYSNMVVIESEQGVSYRLAVGEEDVNRSKIETHGIEFPFEFRWRTSNAIDYKFWRIYGGLKVEYLFSRRSKLVGDNLEIFEGETTFSNPTINQWQYGAMLNFGYNTWNLHLYYAFSELLDENAVFQNENLRVAPFRIGVIFYIL